MTLKQKQCLFELNKTKAYLEELLENISRFSWEQQQELNKIYKQTLDKIIKLENGDF